MKIKFLADEDLRQAIVLGLRRREPSANFVQVYEVSVRGKDDLIVLQIVAEPNRILVSHDVRTLPRHFRHFITRQSSPGVFLIPQKLPLSTAIEQLSLIWLASEVQEWVNQIHFLPL